MRATSLRFPDGIQPNIRIILEIIHMWTKPEYTEMRFGFEVTMYIANR